MSSPKMRVGDRVRFIKDGREVVGTITEFAPRVFGGGGCNINTTQGWTATDGVIEWYPAEGRENVKGLDERR